MRSKKSNDPDWCMEFETCDEDGPCEPFFTGCICDRESGEEICCGIRWEDQARLIAAAPEMLAVLERVQLFIRNGIELGYIYIPDDDPAAQTPGFVDAAIKKARGDK